MNSSTPVEVGDNAVRTSSDNPCEILNFEDYAPALLPVPPAKHKTVAQFIGNLEADERLKTSLENGRRWVADAFYGENGDTVRTLRLRKGWSQSFLAAAISTSQSHIARIERGTENVAIKTCRKIAAALEVDMNTLNKALERQEMIEAAKHR